MWGSVLGLALLTALNPVRLGLTLLVISRPRPVQNLLTYWVGCLAGCIPAVVVPLTLVHVTPMFRPFAADLATSSTVRHIRIGMGVLALLIAALITARSLTRRRQHAPLPTPGGNTSTMVLDSNTPNAISRLLGRTQDAPTEGGSVIRRLLRRVHDAWENGSLWVAFVIGYAFGGTDPDVGLFLVAIIVTSGAAIGHAGQRRHRVRRHDACDYRDHPRQLSGRADENPSGAATAARLGVGSPSTDPGSHLRSGWSLAGGQRHGQRLSAWLRARLPCAAPVPGENVARWSRVSSWFSETV